MGEVGVLMLAVLNFKASIVENQNDCGSKRLNFSNYFSVDASLELSGLSHKRQPLQAV